MASEWQPELIQRGMFKFFRSGRGNYGIKGFVTAKVIAEFTCLYHLQQDFNCGFIVALICYLQEYFDGGFNLVTTWTCSRGDALRYKMLDRYPA